MTTTVQPDIIRDFERLSQDTIARAARFQPAILADVAGRRGAMHGRILDLTYSDASELYRQPPPTWVAAALIEWRHGE